MIRGRLEEELASFMKKKPSQHVDIINYKTVHPTDREPVSIINPDIKKGPWIAGGAALRWYQGLPVGQSDIDVFCRNAQQAYTVIEHIKSFNRQHTTYESANAITLTYYQDNGCENQWNIQVIKRRYFNSIEDVLNDFDLTVCMVGTGGYEWRLGPETARDIREKNLRFLLPLRANAPKRLTKYWTYGYRPVEGTIEQICNNPDTQWEFDPMDDYNAF